MPIYRYKPSLPLTRAVPLLKTTTYYSTPHTHTCYPVTCSRPQSHGEPITQPSPVFSGITPARERLEKVPLT